MELSVNEFIFKRFLISGNVFSCAFWLLQFDPILNNYLFHWVFQAVVSEVPEIILRCISRDEAALAVAQKAFKALYDNASSNLHVSANLAILVAVRDVCKRVVKELTSWVCQ